jgi:calcineurin-like phosphoesterase
MNILFVGDIFGSPGRRIVADHLQDIVQANHIDLTIANGENGAGGFGITPAIAEELFALGLDVMTSGNHVWDKRDLFDYFARQPRLLRPANYPEAPGKGVITYRARNGEPCRVSDTADFTQSFLATGFPYDRATSPACGSEISQDGQQRIDVSRIGATARRGVPTSIHRRKSRRRDFDFQS